MSQKMINNPVIRGFNPDPSMVRVGDDYYIATSTFQWFPGVQLHHSKDLVNWNLIGHALTRKSQLDLAGVESSGGVWAPCLTHDGELFHLIYTNMQTYEGAFWDMTNYLVTARSIDGPWSEPIVLNGSGFDPSMFHDDDGRKWVSNMRVGRGSQQKRFNGIVLQEYCPTEQKLIGDIVKISDGSSLGISEGPHIYKLNGWYYLMLAEGGTDYAHAVTMFRSRDITGPYEADPQNPIMTSANDESLPLQKTGHASIVQVRDGQWYMAHLCSRPLMPEKRSFLCRETAIQKCYWNEDGWLRLSNCKTTADVQVQAPDLPTFESKQAISRDDFDDDKLDIEYATLRNPIDESWADLEANPGHLRLIGRDGLRSRFNQSIIGRRIQHFDCSAQTCVEFDPADFYTSAGLVVIYNRFQWTYLQITRLDDGRKVVRIVESDQGEYQEFDEVMTLPEGEKIHLKAVVKDGRKLNFYYSVGDEQSFGQIGGDFDASCFSDEHCQPRSFTGPFFTMYCQDDDSKSRYADFDYFEYEGND